MMAKLLQFAMGWRVVRNWHKDYKFKKSIVFTFAIGINFASTTKLLKI